MKKPMKTLHRSTTNRVFGGVCAGIADYFDLDPILIRLLFVFMAVFGGAGVIAYIIAWIIMPEKGSDSKIEDAKIVDDHPKTDTFADATTELKKEFGNAAEELKKEFKKVEKEIEEEVKKHKKSSNSWLGIFLIFLGAAFLFRMFGWIHFSWYGIWKYWPIILILIGISLVPMKRWLKNSLMIASLIGLLIAMTCNSHSHSKRCGYSSVKRHSNRTININSSGSNLLTLETSLKGDHATLEIDAGACKLHISKTTKHLSEVWVNGEKKSHVEFTNKNEQHDKFKMTANRDERGEQRVEIALNENPIWDLELNVGAASVNMDLSAFKVREMEINSGAANLDLTIGKHHPETKIEISTGASNIKVRIPKEADCKVIGDSVLMKKRLNGFVKSGRSYRTENFGTAAQTITIEVDGAVGSFEVIRY
jgi:phage shock protein PspC (stress-responsive transcriptional regulator)